MGIHTTQVVYDDVTGLPGGDIREFTFIIDGTRYTLDACKETRDAIRRALQPYIDASTVREMDGSGDDSKLIREWATRNGYSVAPKGRIPLKVAQAYHEAVR